MPSAKGPAFQPADLVAGELVGLMSLLRLISLASLVFVGRLSGYLREGVAFFFAGAVVM